MCFMYIHYTCVCTYNIIRMYVAYAIHHSLMFVYIHYSCVHIYTSFMCLYIYIIRVLTYIHQTQERCTYIKHVNDVYMQRHEFDVYTNT